MTLYLPEIMQPIVVALQSIDCHGSPSLITDFYGILVGIFDGDNADGASHNCIQVTGDREPMKEIESAGVDFAYFVRWVFMGGEIARELVLLGFDFSFHISNNRVQNSKNYKDDKKVDRVVEFEGHE